MIAYHVDRQEQLTLGQVIDFGFCGGVHDNLNAYLRMIYPDGLSYHGTSYFSDQFKSHERIVAGAIEMVFEYERRLHYPDRLSRFQSIFAARTLDGARQWANYFGITNPKIWKIEYSHDFCEEYDASFLALLNTEPPYLRAASLAHSYWRFQESESPLKELLVKCPAQVIELIP